jgi:hypothetical protein
MDEASHLDMAYELAEYGGERRLKHIRERYEFVDSWAESRM